MGDDLGMACNENRCAGRLDGRGQRLDAIDQRALVGGGQPQQHGGDVKVGQCNGKRVGKLARIRDLRRRQIEARRETRGGFRGLRCHSTSMIPDLGRSLTPG